MQQPQQQQQQPQQKQWMKLQKHDASDFCCSNHGIGLCRADSRACHLALSPLQPKHGQCDPAVCGPQSIGIWKKFQAKPGQCDTAAFFSTKALTMRPSRLRTTDCLAFGRNFHQSLDNVTLLCWTFGISFNQSLDSDTCRADMMDIRSFFL